MTLHVFLLLFLLIFCLARLCQLHWLHHSPPHSRAVAVRTTVQRLLKPRSPFDCPACRLASTLPSVMEPAPLPVRPWHEVKSQREAPKRMNELSIISNGCTRGSKKAFLWREAHSHQVAVDIWA